jgi:hypothetical protein
MAELILAGVYLWIAAQGAHDSVTIAGEAILLAWCMGQAWLEWKKLPGCIACTVIFVLLAPAVAEARPAAMPTAQDMQLLGTATCAEFIGIEKMLGEAPKDNLALRRWVVWRHPGLNDPGLKINSGLIARGVAIYCTDQAHAAVTLEQATGAIYDAAWEQATKVPTARDVKAQALVEVLSSPYATESQRWVAAHELFKMGGQQHD